MSRDDIIKAPSSASPGSDWIFIPSLECWISRHASHSRGRITYADGTSYDGDLIAGLVRHGTGTWRESDQVVYEGQFQRNQRHGIGTLKRRQDASSKQFDIVYEGEWAEHVMHGHGTLHYGRDGSHYHGEFAHGQRHGWGKLHTKQCINDANDSLDSPYATYEGEWRDDRMHGIGSYCDCHGGTFLGHYEAGERVEGEFTSRDKREHYRGSWSQGMYHGQGELDIVETGGGGRMPMRRSYRGAFVAGQPHGQGTCRVVPLDQSGQGFEYIGSFCEGMREGRGKLIHLGTQRVVYDGEWRQDAFHGEGRLTLEDGSVHTGRFEEGEAHGHGERQYEPSGHVYIGEWQRGKRHGRGEWHVGQGVVYRGTFRHDECMQGQADVAQSRAHFQGGQQEWACRAQELVHVVVEARDAEGQRRIVGKVDSVSVHVVEPAHPALIHVTPTGLGLYRASVQLASAGQYRLVVKVGDQALGQGPLVLTVLPGPIASIKMQATRRLLSPQEECNDAIELHVRDAFGNAVLAGSNAASLWSDVTKRLRVVWTESAHATTTTAAEMSQTTATLHHDEAGVIRCSLTPSHVGTVRVEAWWHEQVVPGSPLGFIVGSSNGSHPTTPTALIPRMNEKWQLIEEEDDEDEEEEKGQVSLDQAELRQLALHHSDVPVVSNLQDVWKAVRLQTLQQQDDVSSLW